MMFSIRNNHAAHIVLFLLSFLLFTATVTAADPVMTSSAGLPLNNTSLSGAAAPGTPGPLTALEHKEVVTLLDLESDQAVFPGPRSMAFGPRYIRLTSDLPTLFIVAAIICLGVFAALLYRRKKGGNREAEGEES